MKAEINLELGRLDEAKNEFETLAALKKDKTNVTSFMARQRLDSTKELEKMLSQASILARSRILLAQGKAQEVLELQKTIKNPSVDIHITGVMALLQLGKDKPATAQLETMVTQYPERGDVWILWARLIGKDKPGDAAKGLLKAVKTKADGAGTRTLLGEFQYQTGQHETAISTWKDVMLRWPDFTVAQAFLAQAYTLQEKWVSAANVWEKVLKIAPDDMLTLNNLAFCLLKSNKDLGRAKQLTENALLIQPENAEILDTLEKINKAISSQARKAPKPKGSAKISTP